MKEILFRAWHKQKKIMCDVLLICFVNRYVNVLPEYQLEGGNQEEWRFDEIELMQFTGLTDKNGRKVFEGDICSVLFTPQNTSYHGNRPNQYARKVEIRFIGYGFKALNISTKSSRNSRNWKAKSIGAIEFSEFEVIGNIFDHPHLLNKTSNQQQ